MWPLLTPAGLGGQGGDTGLTRDPVGVDCTVCTLGTIKPRYQDLLEQEAGGCSGL